MELGRWLRLYGVICGRLGINPQRDLDSAALLARLIDGRSLASSELKTMFGGMDAVAIFGAGPSLTQDLDEALTFLADCKVLKVAVDGACRAFLERHITPEVVVTDLDGGEEYLTDCSGRGSVMVVHAHGDNMDAVQRLVPRLRGRILGTTQTAPIWPLENFGGFTDGDRAVCMFEELGFRDIIVAGMDFGEDVGPYSKPYPLYGESLRRKRAKLKIGYEICCEVARRGRSRFYDLTSGSEGIPGFTRTSWAEVRERLMSRPIKL